MYFHSLYSLVHRIQDRCYRHYASWTPFLSFFHFFFSFSFFLFSVCQSANVHQRVVDKQKKEWRSSCRAKIKRQRECSFLIGHIIYSSLWQQYCAGNTRAHTTTPKTTTNFSYNPFCTLYGSIWRVLWSQYIIGPIIKSFSGVRKYFARCKDDGSWK